MTDVVVVSNRGPVSFRMEGGTPGGLDRRRRAGRHPAPAARRIGHHLGGGQPRRGRPAGRPGGPPRRRRHPRRRRSTSTQRCSRWPTRSIANGTLWFCHHHLFDLARRPRFDWHWHEAWAGYRRYNREFANAVIEQAPEGATVLVQDYHLSLLGSMLADGAPRPADGPLPPHPLRRARPCSACSPPRGRRAAGRAGRFRRLRVPHRALGVGLPPGLRRPGAGRGGRRRAASRPPSSPRSGPSPKALAAAAEAPATREAAATRLAESVRAGAASSSGSTASSCRRTCCAASGPSRSCSRPGPAGAGEVVFAAFVYPSRETLAEYIGYRSEVEHAVERINERFGTAGVDADPLRPGRRLPPVAGRPHRPTTSCWSTRSGTG